MIFVVYINSGGKTMETKTKPRNRITDFKNDLVFKFMLSDLNDSRCYYLLKVIIEGITAIKCQELVVLNSEVVTMMKEKMDQFNEDEELVLAASKRQLVKIQHHQEKVRIRQEGKEEGLKEGELLKAKEKTLKLFNKLFPDENNQLLENLTLLQYDQIFDTLLENKDLKTIKKIIGK